MKRRTAIARRTAAARRRLGRRGGRRAGGTAPAATAAAARSCATPSSSPRPGSIRPRSATCTRASAPRTCSSRSIATTAWRACRRRSCRTWPRRMPEIADDFRTWTIRIRPGIYFADDPAFKGKPRELVAADFVYALKRHSDPANKDPNYTSFKEEGVLGVEELRQEAMRDKKPFDYEARVGAAGARPLHAAVPARPSRVRASSRPCPTSSICGAVAREVVEFYGERSPSIRSAPARCGWRSGGAARFLAFERNPSYRKVRYDGEPGRRRCRRPGDARAVQGPRAADDRPGRDLDHRGEPAALAGLPQQRDRRADGGAARSSSTQAMPGGQDGAVARQARRADGPVRQRRPARSTTSTWRTRSSAATRRRRWRCAGRSAWRPTSTPRSPQVRRGQAIPAQSPVAPRRLVVRPELQQREQRLQPGPGQGPARPLRLCRPRRRRLARAARTASRW